MKLDRKNILVSLFAISALAALSAYLYPALLFQFWILYVFIACTACAYMIYDLFILHRKYWLRDNIEVDNGSE